MYISKTGENLSYTLKGDANNTEDSEKIMFSKIEGMYVKKLKLIGQMINFMQKPYGIVIVFTIPILLVILIMYNEKIKEERRSRRREKRLNYELKKNKEKLEKKV